jgi:hypothetical protein
VNDLSSSSESGIGGAVEDSAFYGTLSYYYYRTEAYIAFHKEAGNVFRLVLFKSPTYFRLPRIAPDKQVILDKFQSLSIASQIEITKALLNDKGNAQQFTPKELSELIERVAGKQQFDLNDWVLGNFFDQSAQQFMSCVPDVSKLAEYSYGPTQQAEMLRGLTEAESNMKSTIRKFANGALD